MENISNLMASEQWFVFVKMLLHSLWQAALAAILLYALLKSIPACYYTTRYGLSLTTLLVVVFGCFVTWSILALHENPNSLENKADGVVAFIDKEPTIEPYNESLHPSKLAPDESTPIGAQTNQYPQNSKGWLIGIGVFWFVGACFMFGRLVLNIVNVHRYASQCQYTNNPQINHTLAALKKLLRVNRPIKVATGDDIHSPAVLGVIYPVIIIPTSLISGIPPNDLRMILAHEMIHIRRFDYLINLFQMIIEAFLFFNPAIWWINRQICLERETSCDSAVIDALGQRKDYLTTLKKVVDNLTPPLQTIPAMSGKGSSFDLVERFRRIVAPDRHVNPRVTWMSFAGYLLLMFFVLACFQEGADLAVKETSKMLSKEQMDKMTEIEETHGGIPDREYTEEDKITVIGSVKTADGSALPKDLYVTLRSHRPSYGATYSTDIRNGTFTHKVEYGKVYVGARAKGYAIQVKGPYQTEPGGTIEGVDIVLDQGFEANIQFVNQDGNPVPDVSVETQVWVENTTFGPKVEWTGNQKGLITIERLASHPIRTDVWAPGYEYDRKELELSPDETYTWELTPTEITTGQIVTKEGQPVANAEICMLHQAGPFQMSHDPDYARTLVTTDKEGNFTLSSLRDDTIYTLLVKAENRERAFIHQVRAGDEGLHIELGPEIYVKGKVTGDLEQLGKRPRIQYCNVFKIHDGGTHNSWKREEIEIKDGTGYFEIRNLWAGTLKLQVGNQDQSLELTKPVENLSFHLSPQKEEIPSATCTVIFRFDLPEGAAPPTGSLSIYYLKKRGNSQALYPRDVPIENGEARTVIPVPGKVKYQAKSTVGYWFKESDEIEVPKSNLPFLVTIPATPAGSIYGQVIGHDDQPVSSISITPVVVEKPDDVDNNFILLNAGFKTDEDGMFHIRPLPLGGTYAVVAHQNNRIAISETWSVDKENPTHECQLKFVEGVPFEGKVVDQNNQPVSGIEIKASFDTTFRHSIGLRSAYSDKNGLFRFKHLNPSLPGVYELKIQSRRDYCPTSRTVVPTQQNITIQLEKGKTVSGRVVENNTGYPVPGVELWASPSPYDRRPTCYAERATNEKGEFLFSNLSSGKYNLHTRQANLVSQVEVTSGQQDKVTLVVTIPEWSDLKPVKPE